MIVHALNPMWYKFLKKVLVCTFFLFLLPHLNLLSQTLQTMPDLSVSSLNRYPDLEILAEVTPNALRPGDQLTLKIWGRIGNGFHIYSVIPQGEFGPEPTYLFLENRFLKADSDLQESVTIIVNDEAFGTPLKVHKHDFQLQQSFIVGVELPKGPHLIKGSVLYQICDKKICSFPINKDFQFSVQIID
jgi:hypothetical protein